MAASNQRRSPGWIMILVPASPILGLLVYESARALGAPLSVSVTLGICVAFSLVPAIMIGSILRPSRPYARTNPERCAECDANLEGLNANFCPSCGAAVPRPAPDPFIEPERCRACGYDLRGIDVIQCPECGVPVRQGGKRNIEEAGRAVAGGDRTGGSRR